MEKYKNTLKEIIKNVNSWADVKTKMSEYNVHTENKKDTSAGKIFELFTKCYFVTNPTQKDNYKNVWLFDEIPHDIRKNLNLTNQDYGIDLLLEDFEGKFFPVQCKFKNDKSATLKKRGSYYIRKLRGKTKK